MEEYHPFFGCFHKEMTLCILVAQNLPLISLWLNSRDMFAVGSAWLPASTWASVCVCVWGGGRATRGARPRVRMRRFRHTRSLCTCVSVRLRAHAHVCASVCTDLCVFSGAGEGHDSPLTSSHQFTWCLSHILGFCSAPWLEALLLDSCQPQAAFCSQVLSGRLLRYRSPAFARSSAQVWPARLGRDSQGLSRDNWCSHFLPARACHELSCPVTAENTDKPRTQKKPLEALRGCQSSDEHKLPFEISEPARVSTSW